MVADSCSCLLVIFIIISVLEALFFSVMTAGWGSYIYVLIKNGFYADLCDSNSSLNVTTNSSDVIQFSSCRKQQEQLNLLYAIAVTVQKVLCVGWGMIVYRFGTIKPKILSMFLFISGCLMLGFASKNIPLLILPGLVLIGISGLAIIIFNMKITTYLKFGPGIYVAILTGAADSSVITFRLVKLFNDSGIQVLVAFLGIIILHVLISGSSTILHNIFDQRQLEKTAVETTLDLVPENDKADVIMINDKEISYSTTDVIDTDVETHHSPPLKHSVCSCVNYTLIFWYSVNMMGIYMYYGTINKRLVDSFPDKVSEFTNIMAYMLCGGLLSAFIPGVVIEWQRKMCKGKAQETLLQNVLPLALTSIMHIILNILSFVTSEGVFYVEFGVLTLFRSFIFCASVTFVVTAFPIKHSSVLFAICETIGGLVALSQYGLFRWYNISVTSKIHVRIVMTCLSIMTLVHPLMVLLTGTGRYGYNIFCNNKKDDISKYEIKYANGETLKMLKNNEPFLSEQPKVKHK